MAKKYTGKELQKQQRRMVAAQRAINKKLGITLTQSDIKAIGEILLEKYKLISQEEALEAFKDYRSSEGCSCCEGSDHAEHANVLGELLGAKKYSDGSGYEF